VLDPSERLVFEDLVTRLRAGDPRFVDRIERLDRPRWRLRQGLAILLWTIAPVCVVFGGWTGFFMAVAAACYGAHLVLRRPAAAFSWWSGSRHRPGASIKEHRHD
jgi:hypothetical protein